MHIMQNLSQINMMEKDYSKISFFNFESLFDMQEKLRKTRNTKENEELVREIQNGFFDL